MTESLLMLRLEHRNAEGLLNCLEHQLQLLEQGEPINNRLMALSMAYFEAFPDKFHHPKEDLIYKVLVKRSPELAEALGDLVQDHEKLHEKTGRLAQSLRQPNNAEPLAAVLREFLTSYRRHMEAEETRFFPAAEETLTASDWASIDFKVFDSDDPLFHDTAEGDFGELRDLIQSLDEHESERIFYQHHATQLKKLETAADFNKFMADEGQSLRLMRFADQSWGLEDRGKLLYRIPPCSEGRAAWCAALFHQGMVTEHGQPPSGASIP